jgi:hypothetical protein
MADDMLEQGALAVIERVERRDHLGQQTQSFVASFQHGSRPAPVRREGTSPCGEYVNLKPCPAPIALDFVLSMDPQVTRTTRTLLLERLKSELGMAFTDRHHAAVPRALEREHERTADERWSDRMARTPNGS